MTPVLPVVGIMQGRLSPPVSGRIQAFPADTWRDEFARAAAAELAAIEWIFELPGLAHNPITTDPGVAEIRVLVERNGVAVRSVCADYFMDRPFAGATADECAERSAVLDWLIGRAARIGANRIVLPFVDASALRTPADHDAAVSVVAGAVPRAEAEGVELHLETDLGPQPFAALLERLPHPIVRVNYDSGNSASLGYAPADEFRAYGRRVGSVHIKDRVRGGGTVPLGTGATDFAAVFAGIRAAGYAGEYVLQTARGVAGGEVEKAVADRAFALRWITATEEGPA